VRGLENYALMLRNGGPLQNAHVVFDAAAACHAVGVPQILSMFKKSAGHAIGRVNSTVGHACTTRT